jgi:hypothetical protein
MVIEVKIDAVENTLPVELHDKVLESDEFFGHYPPPFLYRNYRHFLTNITIPKNNVMSMNFPKIFSVGHVQMFPDKYIPGFRLPKRPGGVSRQKTNRRQKGTV